MSSAPNKAGKSDVVYKEIYNELKKCAKMVRGLLYLGAGKRIAAGATITIPEGYGVIRITSEAASAANAVTMPVNVVENCIILIKNGDAQALSGDITLAAGKWGLFIYDEATGAWEKALNNE